MYICWQQTTQSNNKWEKCGQQFLLLGASQGCNTRARTEQIKHPLVFSSKHWEAAFGKLIIVIG